MYKLTWRTMTGTTQLGDYKSIDNAKEVALKHNRFKLIFRIYGNVLVADGINETVYEIKRS